MNARLDRFTRRYTGAPGSDEWHAARREFIGASDAAAMLGLHPWSGPLSLYMSKTEPSFREPTNDQMRIGDALEPVILGWWAREVGEGIDRELATLVHRDERRMAANLDAWGLLEGERIVVEAKKADWRSRESFEAWRDGLAQPTGKWAAYWIQVQQQLEVTGCERGHLAVLIGDSFDHVEIPRNRAFGAALRRQIGAWWKRHVEGGELPEASTLDGRALNAIPAHEGEEVDLSEYRETVLRLRAIKDALKALKKERDELETRLKNALGNAERGTFGDEDIKPVTWKTTHRKGYTRVVEPKTTRTFRS